MIQSTDSTVAGSGNRFLIATSVMLTTIMVILDTTVVNVSLPNMMAALGTTSDQITWVLTSYIVATAIIIPLSGYLAGRFGRKRLMFWSVVGFILSSAACGQAGTLTEMVVFRLLQGAFGASVIPLSQSIMVDTFDEKQRGKAMAVWGIGIMLGPILGPTLGGYITNHLDWRWIFYINVPLGLLNLAMILTFLPASSAGKPSRADWLGALFLATGIGALQTALDRGNQEDWLNSYLIVALFAVSVLALGTFVLRSFKRDDAILKISLLVDRNLAISSLMMLAFGLGLYGTIALQPIMMVQLFGYPAETTGLIMAPRGLASAAGMSMVALLINRTGPRALILAGLVLAASGSYLMSRLSLLADSSWILWTGVVQGLGMGMIFVPLTTLAYQTLSKTQTDNGSSIYNLARTIGSSIGISIASTIATRTSQINWNTLGGHIDPYNPALQQWLQNKGLTISDPLAAQLLGEELARQSGMLGFVDAFHFIALSFVALAPLLLLLKGGRNSGGLPLY